MGAPQFTRADLESLTSAELAALADQSGIDIPRDLDRVFIIEALLDLEDEWEEGLNAAGEIALEEARDQETAVLPKQYNITFIDVLIRDPRWVFVYWEIKGQDRETYEQDPAFAGYFLRVSAQSRDAARNAGAADQDFTVAVGLTDGAWYLGFPPGGGQFTVEIRAWLEGGSVLLAVSRPFSLPPLLSGLAEGTSPASAASDALAILAGVNELPVLKHHERASRTPLRRR